jgi:hypothetical protein
MRILNTVISYDLLIAADYGVGKAVGHLLSVFCLKALPLAACKGSPQIIDLRLWCLGRFEYLSGKITVKDLKRTVAPHDQRLRIARDST